MRIIIYIDELCPGTPFRPEKSRTLQAIYWAFADWPQHVLQRTAAWPVSGTVRSTIVEMLPGGVAGFLHRVLLTISADVGKSKKQKLESFGFAQLFKTSKTRAMTKRFL